LNEFAKTPLTSTCEAKDRKRSSSKINNSATNLPLRPFLNFKALLSDPQELQKNAQLRNVELDVPKLQELYQAWNAARLQMQELQHKQNKNASIMKDQIKQLKEPETKIVDEGIAIKRELKHLYVRYEKLEQELYSEASQIPNLTHPSVPMGDEDQALEIDRIGPCISNLPQPNECQDHVQLAERLNLIDLPAGSKVTGTSFYFLKNEGALLEMALIHHAMRLAIQHGFTPVSGPDIIKTRVSSACGFQPRDSRHVQNYTVSHHSQESDLGVRDNPTDGLVLAATAEIPLVSMYAGATLPRTSTPLKMVAFGRAYRAESGARGADTKGLYRVHQFSKVELVSLAHSEDAPNVFADIVRLQEAIVTSLNLTTRVLYMPTMELGAAATCKIDMEAYMPGRRGQWGEISSASWCTDYQARRLDIRIKDKSEKSFAHTLNGTAAAIPRLIVAILEQNQLPDGSVRVPTVLQEWIGKEVLHP
jgi:seryl-tRNA synthetase